MLTSGTVLNKVVDKLNLVNDPEFNGQGAGGLGIMSLHPLDPVAPGWPGRRR